MEINMNEKLELFKKTLNNKKVTVIGMGVSNLPLIKFLCENNACVTACDKRDAQKLSDELETLKNYNITYKLGQEYLSNLDADIIFKTPGMRYDVKELLEAKENGSKITSEMEVFFELCPCKTIAVTGSDGKTTTTTLISEILKHHGKHKVWLGGNIGNPLIGEIENICPNDIAVLELSSFQLHTMRASANISVVTNMSPNHLDMHKGMAEYIDAKKNIYRYQNKDGILVLNFDNDITNSMAAEANGNVRFFSRKEEIKDGVYLQGNEIYAFGKRILNINDIKIPGIHNVENYMAAIAAVYDIADAESIVHVAKNFGGVEHRIEFVREFDGVKYYNDSIASSPTRSIAGFHSFNQKLIIIAGGYDKCIPFDDYGKEVKDHVKKLIVMGNTAEKIKIAAENAGMHDIYKADDMHSAVVKAKEISEKGDIVILSPACASFDMFKNFAQRGNIFKEEVNNL